MTVTHRTAEHASTRAHARDRDASDGTASSGHVRLTPGDPTGTGAAAASGPGVDGDPVGSRSSPTSVTWSSSAGACCRDVRIAYETWGPSTPLATTSCSSSTP